MCKIFLLRIIFLPIMVILLSCHSTISDRYSEDELVRIMLDAHTLGLIYNRQAERTDSLKLDYYDVMELRYGLSQQEFDKLVDELVLNSDLYDRVYGRMAKKVEDMENRGLDDLLEQ